MYKLIEMKLILALLLLAIKIIKTFNLKGLNKCLQFVLRKDTKCF